ncbi:DIP1281 family NlpC/P60 protein [Corynebacterium meridianum]|uniref:C40 family peptidase n=1 Tax=Corynebacterium meridianum TaxID=2765363 RepID=A0A934I2I2_9CORY|nr:NlpC/P60 family protein [Corynebacterium meridianum]MBI8988916.1 C40 family peptidase [Corynebacterium meridianum]MCK7676563.1 NlpC/P60 family protein [Corynebacterium meridianum]
MFTPRHVSDVSAAQSPAPVFSRRMIGLLLTASLACTLTPAAAEPRNPDDSEIAAAEQAVQLSSGEVASLAAGLSAAQEQISGLENEMGRLREAVNKALVDLHDAQATAEQARQNARGARTDLEQTQEELSSEQAKLDEISRSAYRRGTTSLAVSGLAGAKNADDALDRQTFLRTAAAKQQGVLESLDRLRTENANEESQLRAARRVAEDREAEAEAAEAAARAEIEDNARRIEQAAAERDRLAAERDSAQRRLAEARAASGELLNQRKEFEEYTRAEAERKAAEAAAELAARQKAAAAEDSADSRQEAAAAASAAAAAALEAPDRAEAREKAQEAADQAVRAQQVAEKATAEAGNEAAAAQRAQDLMRAASAAASLAAAALVAVNSPDHATLDNPYPREESDADTLIAAVRDTVAVLDENFGGAAGYSASPQPTAADESATVDDTTAADGAGVPAITTAAPAAPTTTTRNGTADDPVTGTLDTVVDYVTLTDLDEVTETATDVITGSRAEKIEGVISRATSVIGTPYAWGGGNAAGPTRGIRDGGIADSYGDYNKIGFDCSGLTLYAFAGAGIALPHYTGYQYQRGTKVSTSNIQRGDLLFWGPNAEYHVAIYLGDGMMIEAPQSGGHVQISPVRWSGMSPYAVRLI